MYLCRHLKKEQEPFLKSFYPSFLYPEQESVDKPTLYPSYYNPRESHICSILFAAMENSSKYMIIVDIYSILIKEKNRKIYLLSCTGAELR